MLLGVLFGWWFVKTRSLWPCVFGHAMNNGVPALLAALPAVHISGYTAQSSYVTEFQPLWFDLLGLTLTIFGIAWTRRIFAGMRAPITARPLTAQSGPRLEDSCVSTTPENHGRNA